MDQTGCTDTGQQVCGFFCHCLVRMMDDRVTPAFLILVCIMCAHQSGCARLRNDSWCVYAKVKAKLELQMVHGKL